MFLCNKTSKFYLEQYPFHNFQYLFVNKYRANLGLSISIWNNVIEVLDRSGDDID